jgi:prevent-host-death family protein
MTAVRGLIFDYGGVLWDMRWDAARELEREHGLAEKAITETLYGSEAWRSVQVGVGDREVPPAGTLPRACPHEQFRTKMYRTRQEAAMAARKNRIQVVKATDARQQFSELVNRVFRERTRVVIERSGIPVAALISAQELERFERLEAERGERFAALEETGRAFGDVPAGELEREVTRAIARVRARGNAGKSPRRRSA